MADAAASSPKSVIAALEEDGQGMIAELAGQKFWSFEQQRAAAYMTSCSVCLQALVPLHEAGTDIVRLCAPSWACHQLPNSDRCLHEKC